MANHTGEEHYEFGLDALKSGNRAGANHQFEQAILRDPKHAKAYALRGVVAFEQGRAFDAMINYSHSIALQPSAEAYNNLGTALSDLGEWDKAQNAYRRSVEIKPDLHNSWNNLGRTCLITGRLDAAAEYFRKSIAIKPDYAEAHMGLAFLALEQGDFETGWKEYEWRKKLTQPRHETLKEWQGESLGDNAGLVLSGEQGIGDVIQFCRYAPLIKGICGGKVYVEARPSVYRLLKTLDGIDGVIAHGDEVPEGVKYHALLMSCPLILNNFTSDRFPCGSPPYLHALPNQVELFAPHMKLLRDDVPKVGICWAGGHGMLSTDRRRSTNLEQWAPLSKVGGIGFVTLQKGGPADQLRTTEHGMTVLNLIDECDDIADTAALIAHCDLVISVDTAMAHLAAALGKPTWVLSRRDACWRWLGDRRDSPWYPTVRHYRQKSMGDWDGLMAEVAGDLKRWRDELG